MHPLLRPRRTRPILLPTCPGCGKDLGRPFRLREIWAFWCADCRPEPILTTPRPPPPKEDTP